MGNKTIKAFKLKDKVKGILKNNIKPVKVISILAVITLFSTKAYALPADGGAMTDQLIEQVLIWIQRIGAIMTVCSLVSFAIAWKADDSEAKSRALQFFIASAMVLSIKSILSIMGIV